MRVITIPHMGMRCNTDAIYGSYIPLLSTGRTGIIPRKQKLSTVFVDLSTGCFRYSNRSYSLAFVRNENLHGKPCRQ
jgi:hypothetical protein